MTSPQKSVQFPVPLRYVFIFFLKMSLILSEVKSFIRRFLKCLLPIPTNFFLIINPIIHLFFDNLYLIAIDFLTVSPKKRTRKKFS